VTAAVTPMQALRLDGNAKRISYDLDIRTTVYSFPYADVAPMGKAGNRMTYTFSGLSGSFSAEEGQKDFAIAHIGIGDATSAATLDGTTIFSADLNPSSGRHFDLTLTPDADGLPITKVSPELDLSAKFFFKPLVADLANVPSYYEDETYSVKLTGGGAPSVKPVKATATFPGGLKILSGSLSLGTSKAGFSPVIASTGSCLVSVSTPPAGSHPLLGHFAVQACP
jgi:hypothetical protein